MVGVTGVVSQSHGAAVVDGGVVLGLQGHGSTVEGAFVDTVVSGLLTGGGDSVVTGGHTTSHSLSISSSSHSFTGPVPGLVGGSKYGVQTQFCACRQVCQLSWKRVAGGQGTEVAGTSQRSQRQKWALLKWFRHKRLNS